MDISIKLYPSRKTLDLQLRIPDQDTECPILQESIQTAVFEKLPRPFYKTHPEHKAIKLGCSHTFHAMALVYHWSRNRNVICPICRAGPTGQRLVLSKLPDDWRYSLSSKVKREMKLDRDEAEHENYRMAAMLSQESMSRNVMSLCIKIEIQAITIANTFTSWRLTTTLQSVGDSMVFEVPSVDISGIPFGAGTTMRLIPFSHSLASVYMMQPTNWFIAGSNTNPSHMFQVEYDTFERKIKSIKLTLQEEEFTGLIMEAYFAASSHPLSLTETF